MSQVPIFDVFNAVIKKAVELNASDIHVSAGGPFRLRIKGEIVPLKTEVLKPQDTASIAAEILVAAKKCGRDNVQKYTESLTDFDCSYSLAQVSRFRVNICSQRGSLALVLRTISFSIPNFDNLGLPAVLRDIALEPRGLILVTGITGSGKSSTLAAMISCANQNRAGKIVTIEDPIEFLHRDIKSTVIQRELGADTESLAKALRAALRQDPDIILVGEMRDKETIDIALKAAETGHLVFSTVHTTDAPKTISRLVSVFEASEQYSTRMRLAETLKAVISQRLLARKDGQGRVVAVEVMRQTKTIQDCIENPEKTAAIKDYMEKGREQYGMQTFDQHLTELYLKELVSLETAKSAATSPADFERNLQYQ
jgi:twitching motility protein PilT